MSRKHLLIIISLAIYVNAAEDGLADFSNDLATDLGPLLALFGESMTRQYLSESITFLDYFIFAMGPVGILTAIISAIRVCGHPSLRAFVGRSQEGNGEVEADLCTSTSRDVCELFNRGGITRVLGRPTILELIWVPKHQNSFEEAECDSEKTNLHLLRYFLFCQSQRHVCDWNHDTEDAVQDGENPALKQNEQYLVSSQDQLLPLDEMNPPNLSLNVGIVRQQKWKFFVVATVGFSLQAGVIALSGAGGWLLGWSLSGGGNRASQEYASIMFITGSLLMCGGLCACAALIGQTTEETRFRRDLSSKEPSKLIWIQPSQVIGDQGFDPFALFEKDEDRLPVWTSSKKSINEKFEFYTFPAVLSVVIGYIMQFIGLRGLKAWVSLAQLGVAIIMSILRGMLRMQRLNARDNRVAEFPNLITGHELDWLAFELLKSSEQPEHLRSNWLTAPNVLSPQQLLCIRTRLAHLTGHLPKSLAQKQSGKYQQWDDKYVAVRATAKSLAVAFCSAADSLIHGKIRHDITFWVPSLVVRMKSGSEPEEHVSIVLKRPNELSASGWTMDAARLEAMLGLALWTFISDDRLLDNQKSLQSHVECWRIISVSSAGNPGNGRQGEMDLWLGPNKIKLRDAVLSIGKGRTNGFVNLWNIRRGERNVTPATGHMAPAPESDLMPGEWEATDRTSESLEMKPKSPPWPVRFCGWNVVTNFLKPSAGSEESAKAVTKISIQYVQSNTSVLNILAQELFASLIIGLRKEVPNTGLKNKMNIDAPKVMENGDNVRLHSPTMDILAKAFHNSGLGSYSDTVLCMVPALGNHFHVTDPEVMLVALINGAASCRRQSEWENAEKLLQYACAENLTESSDLGFPSTINLIVRALRATGELYRWSLTHFDDDGRIQFGLEGIKHMRARYDHLRKRSKDVEELLDSYQKVADKVVTESKNKGLDMERVKDLLLRGMEDEPYSRTDTLTWLSFLGARDFKRSWKCRDARDLTSALPKAAARGWDEVVSAMLEMEANPDSHDDDGISGLSYCAYYGHQNCLKLLLDHGATPDLGDLTPDYDQITGEGTIPPPEHRNTPLVWAASSKNLAIGKILLGTGHVQIHKVHRGQTLESKALTAAISVGDMGFVEWLLDNGATFDFNVQGDSDRPKEIIEDLAAAAASGNKIMMELLLANGGNKFINRTNGKRFGRRPLSVAAEAGHDEIVRVLIANKADINFMDGDLFEDWSPLGWAVKKKRRTTVKLLLENGAAVYARLQEEAYKSGDEEISRLLRMAEELQMKS